MWNGAFAKIAHKCAAHCQSSVDNRPCWTHTHTHSCTHTRALTHIPYICMACSTHTRARHRNGARPKNSPAHKHKKINGMHKLVNKPSDEQHVFDNRMTKHIRVHSSICRRAHLARDVCAIETLPSAKIYICCDNKQKTRGDKADGSIKWLVLVGAGGYRAVAQENRKSKTTKIALHSRAENSVSDTRFGVARGNILRVWKKLFLQFDDHFSITTLCLTTHLNCDDGIQFRSAIRRLWLSKKLLIKCVSQGEWGRLLWNASALYGRMTLFRALFHFSRTNVVLCRCRLCAKNTALSWIMCIFHWIIHCVTFILSYMRACVCVHCLL